MAARVPEGATPDKARLEIEMLLFDMENSISYGKKYEPPPRADLPVLELHPAEYEASAAYCGQFRQHLEDNILLLFATRAIQTHTASGFYQETPNQEVGNE